MAKSIEKSAGSASPTVSFGKFTSENSTHDLPNIQTRVSAILESQFKNAGFEVVAGDDAQFTVEGEFELMPFDATDKNSFRDMKLNLSVKKDGAEIFNDTVITDEAGDIAVALGRSVYFGDTPKYEKGSRRSKSQLLSRLQTSLEQPGIFVDGPKGIVKSTEDSPYSLQIFVNGQPLAASASETDGRGKVKLSEGDEFYVMIENRSEYDAAVDLTFDGVNSFFFAEDKDKTDKPMQYWIVRAGNRCKVSGWYLNNSAVEKFKVTGFEHSAAFKSKVGNTDLSGLISASFAIAWDPSEAKPAPVEVTRGDGDIWIGSGGRTEVDLKPVKRSIGPVRDSIVIEYRTK